jgi:hypothetical protein
MAARNPKIQIVFRYPAVDSVSGVTRKTVKRLAKHLGVDETQAIHQALREIAAKVLPQYEQDDGSVSAAQVRQIKKRAYRKAPGARSDRACSRWNLRR